MEDGTLFNELILREGFASRFRAFPFEPELMKRFEAAETEARRGERGLWRKADPPPVVSGGSGRPPRPAGVGPNDLRCGRRQEAVHRPPSRRRRIRGPRSRRRRADFPGLEALAGKSVLVKGLVEEYKGRIQIMVDVPLQIKVLPRRSLRLTGPSARNIKP